MLGWLRRRQTTKDVSERLYIAVVDAARKPALYATRGVPDTTDGRFEMVALHLVVLLDRLGRMGPEGEALGRAVTETFVVAMDDTMRAVGIGDLAVPRKVKKATAALYDRHNAYAPALAATQSGGDAPALWADALAAEIGTRAKADRLDSAGLAADALAYGRRLASMTDAQLLAGEI